MTQLHIQPQQNPLRVVHQSEILALRREVAELRQALSTFQPSDKTEITKNSERCKLKVAIANGYTFIDTDSILYIEAQGNYCKLHVQSDKNATVHLIAKTLKSVCASLPSSTFFRCHQSYMVNTKNIQSYSYNNGMHLILSNNTSIPVSRRNKKQVLELLKV